MLRSNRIDSWLKLKDNVWQRTNEQPESSVDESSLIKSIKLLRGNIISVFPVAFAKVFITAVWELFFTCQPRLFRIHLIQPVIKIGHVILLNNRHWLELVLLILVYFWLHINFAPLYFRAALLILFINKVSHRVIYDGLVFLIRHGVVWPNLDGFLRHSY